MQEAQTAKLLREAIGSRCELEIAVCSKIQSARDPTATEMLEKLARGVVDVFTPTRRTVSMFEIGSEIRALLLSFREDAIAIAAVATVASVWAKNGNASVKQHKTRNQMCARRQAEGPH